MHVTCKFDSVPSNFSSPKTLSSARFHPVLVAQKEWWDMSSLVCVFVCVLGFLLCFFLPITRLFCRWFRHWSRCRNEESGRIYNRKQFTTSPQWDKTIFRGKFTRDPNKESTKEKRRKTSNRMVNQAQILHGIIPPLSHCAWSQNRSPRICSNDSRVARKITDVTRSAIDGFWCPKFSRDKTRSTCLLN